MARRKSGVTFKSVADPGFPRRGCQAQGKGGDGAPTYYLANFSQKLHENEEILGQIRRYKLSIILNVLSHLNKEIVVQFFNL